MNNIAIKTIGKYAIILSILYGVETLFNYFASPLLMEEGTFLNDILTHSSPLIFAFVINIIAAFIVNADKNKLKIEGKYAVLLTVFYHPIGVVLFLIYVVHQSLNTSSALKEA